MKINFFGVCLLELDRVWDIKGYHNLVKEVGIKTANEFIRSVIIWDEKESIKSNLLKPHSTKVGKKLKIFKDSEKIVVDPPKTPIIKQKVRKNLTNNDISVYNRLL